MNTKLVLFFAIAGCVLLLLTSCQQKRTGSVTVPVTLDHNRMLVAAEIQRKDGSWRKVRLWIDTGNPEFFLSEALASDLGFDLSAKVSTADSRTQALEVQLPGGVRIGGMLLNFKGVKSKVMFEPQWLFSTMHNDANLPSTVLKNYQVVFDYPQLQLTIAEPGALQPKGVPAAAAVHPETGIVRIDAVIDGDSLSFALDNGASYSFVSKNIVEKLSVRNPQWPQVTGTLCCANMWGWWPPKEETLTVFRLPKILWGPVSLIDVGLVSVPKFSPNGPTLGEWYSQKAARPVDGFLGPNAFKAFRVEIDYANNAVYFEKGADFESHDMDIVGLTLRPLPDSSFQVIGIAKKNGQPVVAGIEQGYLLIRVGNIIVTGATMGTVVDALRGKPGDVRTLILERNGKQFKIEARVMHFL